MSRRLILMVVIVAALCLGPAQAADVKDGPGWGEVAIDNGIMVRDARSYDVQTLQGMLYSVIQSLGAVSYLDRTPLAAALGQLQGTSESLSSTTGKLELVLPTVSVTEKKTTDKTPDPSKPGETQERVTSWTVDLVKTQAAPSSVTAPEIKNTGTLAPSGSTLGLAPQDRLAEQLSFTYQIINLSMLLNRAASDRVVFYEGGGTTAAFPRMQAVIGIPVSVQPSAEGQVAQVEVDVKVWCASQNGGNAGNAGKVSLLAQFPQENSYNTATYTRRSQGFSLGTILQVVGLGLAHETTRNQLYLARDCDTVTVDPFLDPDAARTRRTPFMQCSWQFRPVLDEKTVRGGVRYVFMLIALPWSETEVARKIPQATITVRTSWRKYDRKLRVAAGAMMRPSVREFTIPLYPTVLTDRLLAPAVTDVNLAAPASGDTIIDVYGENFFPGTHVLLGGKVYSTDDQTLTRYTDCYLRLRAPVQALADSVLTVVSRNGARSEYGFEAMAPKLTVEKCEVKVVTTDNSQVTLTLKAVGCPDGATPLRGLNGRRPLVMGTLRIPYVVSVGPRMFGNPDSLMELADKDGQRCTATFAVDNATLYANPIILQQLLGGATFRDSCTEYMSWPRVDSVIELARQGKDVTLGITGVNLLSVTNEAPGFKCAIDMLLGKTSCRSASGVAQSPNLVIMTVAKTAWDSAAAALVRRVSDGSLIFINKRQVPPQATTSGGTSTTK